MHDDSRWPDGTPRSRNNAFTSFLFGNVSEQVAKEQSAKRAGEASAATKRANGKPIMPRLYLRGSRFKEAV
jgi:hypothetical protein